MTDDYLLVVSGHRLRSGNLESRLLPLDGERFEALTVQTRPAAAHRCPGTGVGCPCDWLGHTGHGPIRREKPRTGDVTGD